MVGLTKVSFMYHIFYANQATSDKYYIFKMAKRTIAKGYSFNCFILLFMPYKGLVLKLYLIAFIMYSLYFLKCFQGCLYIA